MMFVYGSIASFFTYVFSCLACDRRSRVGDVVSRYPALLDMSSATVSEYMKGLALALGLQVTCIEDMAALREVRHDSR